MDNLNINLGRLIFVVIPTYSIILTLDVDFSPIYYIGVKRLRAPQQVFEPDYHVFEIVPMPGL